MGAMSFAVVSEPDATPDEIAVVSDGLHRFNVAATGLGHHQTVNLFPAEGVQAQRRGRRHGRRRCKVITCFTLS